MKNIKEWSVKLRGDRQDLLNVARLSDSSTMSIREDKGEFYLRSPQFASLRDANEVAAFTGRLLPLLNSFASIYSRSKYPIKAVNVIATQTNGNQVVVNLDSPIWAWGSNDSGQLGMPSVAVQNVPNRITNLPTAGLISAGNRHSLAMKQVGFTTAGQTASGNVFAWGSNAHGELGIGTISSTPVFTPTQVVDLADPTGFLSNVKAIAAGGNHSLALKTDGTVWAWGFNSNGQLGDGTRVDRLSPVRVAGLADIESICSGSFHSLARRSDGSVFAWGFNEEGQLGIGFFSIDAPTPVQVVGPFGRGALSDIGALGAGLLHSLAIRRSDGAVFAWGWNVAGQLGIGNSIWQSVPVQVNGLVGIFRVDGGHEHSLALSSNNELFAWGSNSVGQLGTGSPLGSSQRSPSLVTTPDGQLILSMSAGDYHCLVSNASGGVLAWGNNDSGQLGDGSFNGRAVPGYISFGNVAEISGGSNFSLAFTEPFL